MSTSVQWWKSARGSDAGTDRPSLFTSSARVGTSASTQMSTSDFVPGGTPVQRRCGLRLLPRRRRCAGSGTPKANSPGMRWPWEARGRELHRLLLRYPGLMARDAGCLWHTARLDDWGAGGSEFRPPAPQPASIQGPAGLLEARSRNRDRARPRAVGVVCHPHPLHGGTMQNKVVHTLARRCRSSVPPPCDSIFAASARARAFTRKGTGKSTTRSPRSRGRGRAGTASRSGWPASRSAPRWRSGVRGRGAARSSPLRRPSADCSSIRSRVRPAPGSWCRAIATSSSISQRSRLGRSLRARRRARAMHGAEHFFHGRLVELRSVVIDFLSGKSALSG